ncbi:MAG TPA: RNA methyltransferase [Burkholderiales bacterium]
MITSKDNPRVKRWARLARDARLRRKERRAIVEGPHLVALAEPLVLLASESGLKRKEIQEILAGREAIVLADKVFRAIADAGSPQGLAAEIEIPEAGSVAAPAVFLEGVQDPGNAGAILRSAAAFGVRAVVLDRACADPWSPKVLRAGMGAHFALSIHETDNLPDAIESFEGRVLCAVPRGGINLAEANLSGQIGWLFGAEGAGVSPALQTIAAQRVTLPMAPGTESINVGAAAAIFFYTAFCAESPPWQGGSELASGGCR